MSFWARSRDTSVVDAPAAPAGRRPEPVPRPSLVRPLRASAFQCEPDTLLPYL